MDTLLTLSAAEIARRIRSGALSPVEAVEAHIARIERVNPQINAVVTPLFAAARQQAHAAAERLAQGGSDDLPPLFGVPVTIKDSWGVAGVRFTGGSWYHRDDIASEDAPAVKLLRDAGAIILGKTNLPDMCWAGETVNPVFGRTNNPHHLRHMVGGSSGGEGAIIAAGGSPLGLGSDIAGSVRIPAAACGIVSLKPTGGRIPAEGHLPTPPQGIYNWNTAGPMARRVEDLALALGVLSRTPVQDYRQIELAGRRATVYMDNPFVFVTARVKRAVMRAAGALQAAGMQVNERRDVPLTAAASLYMGIMHQSGGALAFEQAIGGGTRMRVVDEVRRGLRGQWQVSPEVLLFARSISLIGVFYGMLGYADTNRLAQVRERFLEIMGTGGVLLTPLLASATPRHGWTWWFPFGSLPYTFMFNALGFPAAVVPVGWTPQGLPLVVQVVATPGEDETALAVAAELERVFGGWRLATGAG